MDTDTLRGTGKLYDADVKEVIATVNYQLWEKPETEDTNRKWWGGFTFDRLIAPAEYVIELEDGRRGACFLRVNMQGGRGVATTYYYSFQGSGALK